MGSRPTPIRPGCSNGMGIQARRARSSLTGRRTPCAHSRRGLPERRSKCPRSISASTYSQAALQHLARIENALGIEQALDAAHQFERDRVFHRRQQVAFEEPDAVLGGDRAAVFFHDREYDVVHLAPALEKRFFVGADRLADIVVDIAVAEM